MSNVGIVERGEGMNMNTDRIWESKRADARRRAQDLVSQMTVEEKASQLLYNSPAIERLNIPAYNWWNEGLHGVARAGTATMFPQAIALAAAFDEDLMEEVGDCIATEARAKYNLQIKHGDRDIYKGLTFWSPNVNIFRDPRWGRGHETYGEDPYLTARLGVRFVEGLQGKGEFMKTAACAKHFAVHSGPEAVRHKFNAEASAKDMEETYLPAFEACVKEAGVEAVMGAYNRTNGEVCCGSPSLQKILRGDWGFEGHFVSDCWAISDFHEYHHITEGPKESAKLALENGTDVNCGCTYARILDAFHEGMIDEKYITQSCVRLFTARFLLGMFDETEYDSIPYTEVESKDHLALASRAAREGIVLLKNNGVLPLNAFKLRTIGVIGPNANSRAALMGNYHGTASRYITILEGIQNLAAQNGIRVLYSEGCHIYKDKVESLSEMEQDRLSEAKGVLENSDVAIIVVGLDENLEGEEGDTGNAYASGDKKDLHLPNSQEMLIRELMYFNSTLPEGEKKPLIVINVSGSAIDLSEADEEADAILQVFYPGSNGGADTAAVLFGDVSPSGKLPVTFYYGVTDLPEFTDYSMKGRTYRYYEGKPLYPFGYGLTYGDCRVTGAAAAAAEENMKNGLQLKVHVKNDGAETDDVLQIYVRDEDSSFAPPNPSLAAFCRVHLDCGEEKDVTIWVPERAFTTVDEDGVRKVRGSHFAVYAGFSQPGERSEELTGCRPVKIMV